MGNATSKRSEAFPVDYHTHTHDGHHAMRMRNKVRQRAANRDLADRKPDRTFRQPISPGRERLEPRRAEQSLFWCLTPRPLSGLAVICCLFILFIGALQSSILFGNGYSSDGGLVGKWVDQRNLRHYVQAQQSWRPPGVVFPDVQIKATRKTDKSHYNLFLGEILQKHQSSQSNIQWDGPQSSSLDSSTLNRHHRRVIDSIQLSGATATYSITHANNLEDDLRVERCHSNWFCQRCLNAPRQGTYTACSALCRRCYIRILSTIPGRHDPPLRLEPNWSTDEQPLSSRRIPRIIHQAWHIFPRSWEFPELARLMSTWRSQPGYEHRFYHTVEQGCSLAYESFSTVVGKACDMISSRIRKQKFLELLLLYEHGGIFADVDVMLETSLDALMDDSTSFFAAKTPGIVDSCLFTGLVGAEPGHPVIGRAIENVLRALLLRTTEDRVAFERDFMGRASKPYDTELWKLRATEDWNDFIFKDCALGVAWNQVLETENPLAAIDIGPHHLDEAWEANILLMSHRDTGATRISDIERNVLIASTDLPGVAGFTIQQRGKTSIRKQNIAKQELVE